MIANITHMFMEHVTSQLSKNGHLINLIWGNGYMYVMFHKVPNGILLQTTLKEKKNMCQLLEMRTFNSKKAIKTIKGRSHIDRFYRLLLKLYVHWRLTLKSSQTWRDTRYYFTSMHATVAMQHSICGPKNLKTGMMNFSKSFIKRLTTVTNFTKSWRAKMFKLFYMLHVDQMSIVPSVFLVVVNMPRRCFSTKRRLIDSKTSSDKAIHFRSRNSLSQPSISNSLSNTLRDCKKSSTDWTLEMKTPNPHS